MGKPGARVRAEAGWDERLLAWTGRDEPEIAHAKARSVRRLILLTLAAESWLALRYQPYSASPGLYGGVAIALSVLAVAGWRERFARVAVTAGAALLLFVIASVFPENANHQYLGLLVLVLLMFAHGGEGSAGDALAGLRWLVLIGIFWAGLQKLWYGYYSGAEFLSLRVAIDPSFREVLGFLVPPGEQERLATLTVAAGQGPFRAQAPLLVAVSKLTLLAEIGLPIALVWTRTRALAVPATIALFVGIQLGAREVFFGGLMIGLVLLFARRDALGRALPWIAGLYLVWLLLPDLAPGWQLR